MERIQGDGWFVNGNELSRSLMRFFVKIDINKNSRCIYHQLKVIDSNRDTLVFNFYTIEDAISFTQNIVNKCETLNDIATKYEELYEQKKLQGPKVEIEQELDEDKVTLTPEEVEEAIIGYFGAGKGYRISVASEPSLDFKGNPKVFYYIIEHYESDGIHRTNRSMLTNSDIRTALEHYLSDLDCDITGFKYICGVRRVGFFVDEDTPRYDGIEVDVREKEKPYRLIKRNENEKRD